MFQISIAMAKQVYECNWAPSRVTEEQLNNLVKTGALAKKMSSTGGSLARKILLHPKTER